jgi:hypothetical protein
MSKAIEGQESIASPFKTGIVDNHNHSQTISRVQSRNVNHGSICSDGNLSQKDPVLEHTGLSILIPEKEDAFDLLSGLPRICSDSSHIYSLDIILHDKVLQTYVTV